MKKIQYISLAFAIMLPFTASAANFIFSPALGSYTTGDTFTTSVFVVPAAGESISATKVSLTFPADKLEATAYTPVSGGSILAHIGTSTDNAAGIIVDNVAFNPAITTSTKVATITFKAKATGAAALAVSADAKILDSANTEKQTSSAGAAYTVAAPVVATVTTTPPATTPPPATTTPNTTPTPTQTSTQTDTEGDSSESDGEPVEEDIEVVVDPATADGSDNQLAAAATSTGFVGTVTGNWAYILLILILATVGWWFIIGKKRKKGSL